MKPGPKPLTMADFWDRVVFPGECWEWTGAVSSGGYGMFGSGRTAYRLAYETLVGPVPDGLTLDHLCRNRLCVNPTHLEPVTAKENVLRGDGITAENARKTRCVNGHDLTGKNLRVRRDGSRACRECGLAAQRRYAAAHPDLRQQRRRDYWQLNHR